MTEYLLIVVLMTFLIIVFFYFDLRYDAYTFMLVNNESPKTIRMFMGKRDYNKEEDEDEEEDSPFFAETDLVEQRFYKN